MARRVVAAGVVAAVAIAVASAGLAALTVPASAAANDPAAACSAVADEVPADQRRVVGLPSAGGEPLTGPVALYSGSRIEVVLCEGDGTVVPTGDGQIWRLANGSVVEPVGVRQYAWVARVTGNGSVDLADRVAGRTVREGLRVTGRRGTGVNATLVAGTLSFPNRTVADRYRGAERRFLDAVERVNAAATAINATARGVDEGDGGVGAATARRVRTNLSALAEARERVRESGEALQRTLYVAATDGFLTAAQSTALSAVERRQSAALGQSRGAVQRYLAAVDRGSESARGSVGFVGGLAGVFGLLVGAVAGFTVTLFRPSSRAVVVTGAVALGLVAAGVALGFVTGLHRVIL
ncbi:MAG: hypothetical protein ABEJ40_02395 [Haloarculaceae archaeon]